MTGDSAPGQHPGQPAPPKVLDRPLGVFFWNGVTSATLFQASPKSAMIDLLACWCGYVQGSQDQASATGVPPCERRLTAALQRGRSERVGESGGGGGEAKWRRRVRPAIADDILQTPPRRMGDIQSVGGRRARGVTGWLRQSEKNENLEHCRDIVTSWACSSDM